jgi:hypothetical protein
MQPLCLGRFFVFDLATPGLAATRRGADAFDITWRNGVTRTLYDGDWQKQNLSEEDYRERFRKDEADDANLLRILLATARRTVAPVTFSCTRRIARVSQQDRRRSDVDYIVTRSRQSLPDNLVVAPPCSFTNHPSR